MVAKRRDQARVTLFDLLEREAALLLHQVDQTQVPGRQRHHVAIGELVALFVVRRVGAGGLVDRVTDRGVVLVALSDVRNRPAFDRPLDELTEVVSVALLERRPLRLPVV